MSFAEEGFCKSCGWSKDFNDQTTLRAVAKAGKRSHRFGFKFKLAVGLFAFIAIAAGVVIAHFKLTKYFDKTPLHLAAISNSEKFREPLTVRVNRKQLPSGGTDLSLLGKGSKAGSAVKAAEVLEALGLLTMSIETSVSTVSMMAQPSLAQFDVSGRMIRGPGSMTKLVDVESERLVIELTESGRQEALNWKEADQPLKTSRWEYTVPWWIIPVGEREIVRIDSATPEAAESQFETVQVIFRWRWRPNKLGQNFDPHSPSFNSLPAKAQLAAKNFGLNSRDEYAGHAKLQKQYGRWECVDINFVDEMVRLVRGD